MSSDGFYPPRLWGLDKLYWAHVQLNVVDVLELPEYPGQSGSGCYSLGNHPVSRVEVMGDIVRLHGKSRNVVFDVDDGTGIISCCLWRPDRDSDDGIPKLELGQLVTVQGRMTLYLGARQITVSAIFFETDVHAECRRWLELAYLKTNIYSKPFVVPENLPKDAGWNPDATEEAETKFEMKQAITDYLFREKIRDFTFAELQNEPLLVSIAADTIISAETELTADKLTAMIKHVLASAVRSLVEEGCLCITDYVEDRYQVIDHTTIIPLMLKTIEELQTSGNGQTAGVHRETVITSLRSQQKLCKVKRSVFMETIDRLVKSSELYESFLLEG